MPEYNPILTKLSPLYPGQWGVLGSDAPLGIRTSPQALVLYVDGSHARASNNNDGTDPNNPLATVQGAVTKLITWQTALGVSLVGSVIVVAAEMAIREAVIIPITAPKGCSIIGMSSGGYSPVWASGAAGSNALTVRQENWRISGFTFTPPATAAAIRLEWTGATANGSGTLIDHNTFSTFQAANGRYGINFIGAPYNVNIYDNEFSEFTDGAAGAFAIYCESSATACPLLCRIERNLFREIDNMIGSQGSLHGLGSTLIKDNVFALSPQLATTLVIDLRGGNTGHNTVVGNFLGTSPDYSQPGGYWDNANHAGCWVGNHTLDVAEAEVSTAGLTILPPAA